MRSFLRLLSLGCLIAASGPSRAGDSGPRSAPPAQSVTVLKAAHLFDGKSESLQDDVTIVIQAGRISQLGKGLAVPPGARVIDLGGRTVMPGLIDAHTHLLLHAGDYDAQILRETPELRAILATRSARLTLEAGVTTVRDLGNEGAGFADLALRDAIARGAVPGPRILGAIHPVTSTGGYRLVGYSPYLAMPPIAAAADGPAAVRREVRKLIEQGADVIKIYLESYEKKQVQADRLSGAMNYSQEELDALVDEAHRGGTRVAGHTYSDAAARMAIAAGVDSIEHGLYLSAATFKLMAQKNIAYVPTLLVYELWRDGKIFAPVSAQDKLRLDNTVREHTQSFRHALSTPVKIVFGTDTFELPGTNAQELALMVRYGMKPLDALRSATSGAAELLGVADVTGTLAVGKSADLIGVATNPMLDIRSVEAVGFVMKEGVVFVDKR